MSVCLSREYYELSDIYGNIASPNRQEESVGADLEMGQRVEKGTTYRQRGCYGVKLPAPSYGVLGEGESMEIN